MGGAPAMGEPMQEITAAAVATKPRWRGVSHQWASLVSAVCGALLVARAEAAAPGGGRGATAIYAGSLTLLFAVSATYHRVDWRSMRARARMRRLDHAAIYLLIAGTYTPFCTLALPPQLGLRVLGLVWGGAALGAIKTMLWPQAPKPLSALLYVLLGAVMLPHAQTLRAEVGATGLTLVLGGGLLYALGSLIYALRWPIRRRAALATMKSFTCWL